MGGTQSGTEPYTDIHRLTLECDTPMRVIPRNAILGLKLSLSCRTEVS